jgi:aminodeoxyfutalosine synthase
MADQSTSLRSLRATLSPDLQLIHDKIIEGQRLSAEEGIRLFEDGPLAWLGAHANRIREQRHGNTTFFNRNFHIEPTNLCVFACKFCAYSRKIKQREDGWVMTTEQILDAVRAYEGKPITEVHIVGGVLPEMNLKWFAGVLQEIKNIRPELHIKGFTAVELEYMFRKGKVSIREGLEHLREHGLDSLPGGGAEIFDEEVRDEICGDKCDSKTWLEIHQTAHELGMATNCTMLYGHIENYRHRVDHMMRLRDLQDETGGFNTFIPLKYRSGHNEMSHVGESSLLDDLRTYAVARIFMDNIPHLKAYWPMLGRDHAQLMQAYGVNDLDGTIDDSTKIYSMAGAEEQRPELSTREIVQLVKAAGRKPVERDTLYNTLKDYSEVEFASEDQGFIELPLSQS